MFREHPWVGVGLGRYPADYTRRGVGPDSTHAYNIVVHVAAETGMAGLVPYLVLWGRVLWLSLREASRRGAGPAAFAVHGMLVAFFLRSQSEHFLANLATSFRLLMLLGVLFGLAEGLAALRSRREAPAAQGRL
jgi:O-antigen ligase